MKIGIVGNYGNNNNGDEAILLGIIHQLNKHLHVDPKDIVVFSNNPEQTKDRYGTMAASLYVKKSSPYKTMLATIKANWPIIKKLDLLIIGGGGILMDLYRREPLLYGSYGMMGNFSGTKVVIYGVGAGPIDTLIGKFFINRLAKKAASVSVRDPQSKELLHSIGVKKNIEVIGDPAFSIEVPKKHMKSHSIKKIGVTAVPYFNKKYWPEGNEEKYQMYVTGMAENLDRLIDATNVDVTFFSTKYPQDVWVTEDIAKKMKNSEKVKLISDHLSPTELTTVCAEQDLVIGTRLHSIILSIDTETPVIGVAYHHKVEHFMKMINKENQCVTMAELESGEKSFNSIIKRLENSWEEEQEDFVRISKELKQKSAKGISQFKS